MSVIASLRTFWVTFKIGVRTSAESKTNVVFSLLTAAVSILVLLGVYRIAMEKTGSIAGMTYVTAMWSLSMYNIHWAVGTRNLFKDITNDIKSGAVETRLVRPASYLWTTIFFRIGKNFPMFIIHTLFSFGLLISVVGFPAGYISTVWLLSVAATFLLGTTTGIFMYVSVGLTAFWLQEATPVMWIVDKAVMILGGSFVPIAFFPPVLRLISERSPFGAILAFSQAFAPDFLSRLPLIVASQCTWLVILGVGCAGVWRLARRRIAVNGG
jgi:ABC-2 type transport system permease protein